MLKLVIEKQKETKNLWMLVGVLVLVFTLYSSLDLLQHGSLSTMVADLGMPLLILHILINIVMASFSALMISLSQIKLNLTKSEPKGATGIPFLSFIFGLLTFGCAPCVVTFLAAIGISFTPIVFPNGNLLWKLVLIGLLAIGFIYILYSIEKGTCKIKPASLNTENE
ncbi:MAG: hypothetical protein ACLFUQ_01365 [Candidatus Izemoplasmataceae bacterium]